MNARFDERQVAVRHRIAMSSFAVVMAAAILNGWAVDAWGAWGSATDQAFAVVYVGVATFTWQAVWRGAYFAGRKGRRTTLTVFGLLALLYVVLGVLNLVKGCPGAWVDGHAGQDFFITLVSVFFVLSVALMGLRTWLDVREERADS